MNKNNLSPIYEFAYVISTTHFMASGVVNARTQRDAEKEVETIISKIKSYYNDEKNIAINLGNMTGHTINVHSSKEQATILHWDVSPCEMVVEHGDSHNPKLRSVINNICANLSCRNRLSTILQAYFERDKEELANRYNEECVWWKMDKITYDEALEMVGFDELAFEMFNHILDDEDYKAIINFIRPTWICEKWWELIY